MSTKLWVCNDCTYFFGSPYFNAQREMTRCTQCNSKNITLFRIFEDGKLTYENKEIAAKFKIPPVET